MSIGNFISGIAYGVVGFFVGGGPAGAAWGFAIGFGMSVAMDALAPDQPSPGQPQTAELAFPSAQEGGNIPDILGTTKLSGNFIQYWGNRVVEIKEDSGGKGSGGGGDVTTGYKYFLSFVMGICLGPTDVLFAVYAGDELIWSGETERPETGGLEIIVIGETDKTGNVSVPDDTDAPFIGNMYLYFGTDDQAINTKMQADKPYTPAYRGLCYAFFDDCYIGKYNRVPPIKFIIGKFPVLEFNENNRIGLEDDEIEYDYNPVHAIWYIMTNDLMAALPEEFMDAVTFSDVADTIYTERRGVSILFDRQQSTMAYIETIVDHIGAIVRYGCDGDLADE